ncbi:hypothetical protein [Nostoc sp. FACHB-133]|uniref:hypothetical protein n=1 Tax=Nostoc sp. FACHB-133 TaxID=2692835 RepID=UPI0016863635|nr:hypothetical protein [Nostoc sp. FACHB-133]MBD2526426.1 hypothetical protein [Nostoc sp. FACHB-133]
MQLISDGAVSPTGSDRTAAGKRELGRCPNCYAEASGGTEATVFDGYSEEAVECD